MLISVWFSKKTRTTYSSNCIAPKYIKNTRTVNKIPANLPRTNAHPKKLHVLPQYIGAPVTLKGNPSTLWSIKIPK